MKAKGFEESATDTIIECIDQALSELEIYHPLYIYEIAANSFGVTKEQIPEYPEAFMETLQSLFGSKSIAFEKRMKNLIVETFRLRKESSLLGLSELIFEIMYGAKFLEEENKLSMFGI